MNNIKKIKSVKELLPIFGQKIEHDNVQTVNARDVHEFLEVKTLFKDWIQRYIKRYDFIEGVDYICCSNLSSKSGSGGHNIKEYYVSLDMAKELSMVQNNPKGKEARQYFIQCEKIAKAVILKEAQQIKRQSDREWKQLRDNSKATRKNCTDAIQKFCDYAISQGSKNASFYYKALTDAEYDAVIIPGGHMEIRNRKKELKKTNGRDVMTTDELIRISIMDMTATRKAVDDALEAGGDYHKIYPMIKEKILMYGQMINNSLLLQENTKVLAMAV